MKPSVTKHSRRRGSSVLIVLVVLAAMATIIVANNATLFWLKQEIIQVEQRQIKKHGPSRNH